MMTYDDLKQLSFLLAQFELQYSEDKYVKNNIIPIRDSKRAVRHVIREAKFLNGSR